MLDKPIDTLEDFEAVWAYLKRQDPKTSKGVEIKNDALRFFEDVGWWEKDNKDTFNKARTWRNKYNLQEDPENTKRVLQGKSYEEIYGGARPEIDPETGQVGEKEPWIPTKYKMAAAVTAVGIATLAVLKRIRLI